ncbi:dTMP kinase [Streptomyces clavuligerus]|uniref:Thymidylate kinase n=1 Tax=Streptomyces clavuligerus TaxID=1901 RepID=E2Q9M8_STRCL|nr:dTMP kinase [Streptomyces clavuligerus]ANW19580.1 dTMP kinase [Streptomyces clavuligerus]AXU14186.1 dTMP kinase [Streptomyces clavuligerus]EFG07605.1 Thymidylate kinase [Streptomyces clavuligerus]MBY6304183.1 dTMP kinase [Streptomyces clavuligerus]QCS06959.1 dTMP kinase [Streptomyces clavuligerus]
MTRSEQPAEQQAAVGPVSGTAPGPDDSDALAADSRERALRALLRVPTLRTLWNAQAVGGIGDALAVLVLLLLTLQAAVVEGGFGGGYRGAALSVAAVLGVRAVATVLFGAVLLGPLARLTSSGGPLDRRWTMIGADGVRLVLLVLAPLWIDWTPDSAAVILLATVLVTGAAERLWTVARDGAAPALLPAPPLEGAAVRPLPDHLGALRRLWLRTSFLAIPAGAAVLLVATLIGRLLGTGIDWFSVHQAALGSYVAAGLFSASAALVWSVTLPGGTTPRPRSPFEGLRRPPRAAAAVDGGAAGDGGAAEGKDAGRTGAVPFYVLACAAVAGAVAAAVSVSVLHAADLGGGPSAFALLVLALTGGTAVGIRAARSVLPTLSRRRLLALAVAVTGVALLATGLVPDTATVLFLAVLAGVSAGVAANVGHALVDQETEAPRQARMTDHLQAVVRVAVGAGALAAPLLAAAIGPYRLAVGDAVLAHGGAAFTLMLAGALLLPVAAVVLARTDDRAGVPLRRDLGEALRGGADPAQAPAATGFFIALEGGDGAGKSTQAEALATWIRNKGHEVVVTREPGATPVGKRLRSILLDVASAGLSNRAEALLYAADRAEHVGSVVRPALERGAVVISDRYIDSSVAYQGAGRDLSPTEIARISRWATDGLVPHLTVLLDVSPETARERFTEAPDRLESEPAEFHRRVRSGFLTLAAGDPARYLVVDAGQEPEAVTTVVRHRLDQMLPLSEAEVRAREEARRREAERIAEEARRKAEEEAARKAEEERLERERQEQLARLRAEEEERRKAEEEEAKRLEAERLAEEARQRAEETRRLAEEERRRREAEERARREEQERLRVLAAEQARLRAEAEARRLEKQRKAEEALLRAEAARREAEEQERRAAEERRAAAELSAQEKTVETPLPAPPAEGSGSRSRSREGAGADGDGDEITVVTPVVRPDDETQEVPGAGRGGAADSRSRGSGSGVSGPVSAMDETAVLPPVRDAGADMEETAVLPPVRDERPVDKVPPGFFRDESGASPVPPSAPSSAAPSSAGAPAGQAEPQDRTRELPRIDPDGAAPAGAEQSPRRRRPAWAEETPLDDLPTLADELLGGYEGDDHRRPGNGGGDGTTGRERGPRR